MNEYYTKFEGIIGLYLLSGSLWTIGPDTPFLMLLIAMTNLYIFWHNYIIVLLRRSNTNIYHWIFSVPLAFTLKIERVLCVTYLFVVVVLVGTASRRVVSHEKKELIDIPVNFVARFLLITLSTIPSANTTFSVPSHRHTSVYISGIQTYVYKFDRSTHNTKQ